MKILCTIPNASEEINGVKFEEHEKGMISVGPVTDDEAATFLLIPGYESVDHVATPAEKKAAEKKQKGEAPAEPAADPVK